MNTNDIDPTKPLRPLRFSFPVPPVFTAEWTPEDWQAWERAHGVPEPLVLTTRSMGRWEAVGRNAAGAIVYRRAGA